jgi:hypothetical protein
MRNKLMASLAFSFLIAGCAGVSRQDMLKESEGFQLPGDADKVPGKAMVYVVRPSAVGTLVRFNVFVDNTKEDSLEAGFNRGAQHFWFTVAPGPHKLLSVAENTADMEIDFKADSVYYVRQDAKMGIVMARNNLVQIDEVEGKYNLKKTKLGTVKRKSF